MIFWGFESDLWSIYLLATERGCVRRTLCVGMTGSLPCFRPYISQEVSSCHAEQLAALLYYNQEERIERHKAACSAVWRCGCNQEWFN